MSLGKKMFHGMVWSAIERVSVQALQFLLNIILARLLTPEEYGIIGILIVFIAISNVFVDSGFTKALIQKQDRSQTDISTVFWFNILISVFCYVAIWLASSYIADFYELESLVILLRTLALAIIFNALFAVPSTLYTIDLDFKTITKINLIATITSGSSAIYLAYQGYGVWALIFQTLTRTSFTAILMWFWLKWKPKWIFSKTSLKGMFSYGSNLLVSSLINVSVNNLYSLFIAKVISTGDLGYYTRGTQFANFVQGIIGPVIENVLLPGLSTIQHQRTVLISHTQSIIKASALVAVPLFLFLTVIAEPLIRLLLTEKWMLAVPIMQLICIARLITVISSINVNLLYVVGRTDLALKQQYAKIGVRVVLLIAALKYGIVYIAIAELLSTAIHFFINTYHPGKIMSYGALAQLKDIRFIILSGLIMVFTAHLSTFYIENDLLRLVIAAVVALPIYFIFIRLFKIKELSMLIGKFKDLIPKK